MRAPENSRKKRTVRRFGRLLLLIDQSGHCSHHSHSPHRDTSLKRPCSHAIHSLASTGLVRPLRSLLVSGRLTAFDGHHGDCFSALSTPDHPPPHRYIARGRKDIAKQGGEAIAYDPVGSSAGMQRIRQRATDFGASDAIDSSDALTKDGLVMFPTVITGVVPVVNLPSGSNPDQTQRRGACRDISR